MIIGTETQRAQLVALLRRVREAPSPFYRDRIAHTAADSVNDPEQVLAGLALTRREELLLDQVTHLPNGTRQFADAPPAVRAGVSGSGADLVVLTWSSADLARERAAGTRLLRGLGVRPGMRVANTLPGALATPGSLLLGDAVEELGALDVPLGTVENENAARQAWELIDRVQPDVIVLDDPSARRLFAAVPSAVRPWWQGIVWLVCGTSTPRPAIPEACAFTGWQRTWLAIPEVSSFVAHACAASRLHVDENIVAEIIDGTLVLTLLASDTPVLRYASGVRARALSGKCSCETAGFVLELT